EDVLARDPRTGRFCCGDQPTIADICLVAHLVSAKMLCDSDPAPYPTARRILDACMQIEAFALEHPLRQAGARTAAARAALGAARARGALNLDQVRQYNPPSG